MSSSPDIQANEVLVNIISGIIIKTHTHTHTHIGWIKFEAGIRRGDLLTYLILQVVVSFL